VCKGKKKRQTNLEMARPRAMEAFSLFEAANLKAFERK
jgi:hypothetical protein